MEQRTIHLDREPHMPVGREHVWLAALAIHHILSDEWLYKTFSESTYCLAWQAENAAHGRHSSAAFDSAEEYCL